MVRFKIRLQTMDDVNEFEDILNSVNEDADATAPGCSYIVDAKSLMGLLTLNFANPIEISINGDDASVIDKFNKWREKDSLIPTGKPVGLFNNPW